MICKEIDNICFIYCLCITVPRLSCKKGRNIRWTFGSLSFFLNLIIWCFIICTIYIYNDNFSLMFDHCPFVQTFYFRDYFFSCVLYETIIIVYKTFTFQFVCFCHTINFSLAWYTPCHLFFLDMIFLLVMWHFCDAFCNSLIWYICLL